MALSPSASYKSHYQNFTPPFDIPDSWEWVRLEDIAYVASGSTPSKESFVPNGIPYLKMYNLRKQRIDFQYQPQYISEEVHNGKLSRSRATAGDIIMNIVGPPLGKIAIIPTSFKECNFNQAAVMIRPFYMKDILAEYLFNYLEEMTEINCISTKGTAGQVNISLTQAQNMRISLPPIGEIIRINEIVRQYRGIFETLESSYNELTESIAKTKSKILDLAMQGKLVPQDSTDEPATDMLRRINPKARIITDNPHYPQLPDNWVLTTVESVCNYGYSENVGVDNIESLDWVLELEDIEKDSGRIITKKVKQERAINGVRHRFAKDNVLYSKLRTYLNKVLVAPTDGYCTTEIIPVKSSDCVIPEYLCAWLRSPFFLSYTAECCYGVKMPRLSTTDARKGIIPLPPINEQKRIIQKLNEISTSLECLSNSLS
ncbi:restriction endonuclease subunit S [Sangeribacter muris]|uniref:restriction endonuclease subunit S n=1 Tax=Sangeribacter muris TaxID=2880703 RepID=UPI00244DF966|nr:restriction endonuclease subunit S [Sangeribacter muris]